eukprot:CAMPEP_0115675470 /NCGR_PEP_ID=MMETSP0272-20121206/54166_1 /TAXON_ID=71861 /ORGANISM="Scrippsiella trochoidea, Strain CCMP3099" /LENGTH=137 /DNA_ID=CAMNT_0003114437 /DNA_START=838 /DNA_END=1251 /DNA_ORIENTATION=+
MSWLSRPLCNTKVVERLEWLAKHLGRRSAVTPAFWLLSSSNASGRKAVSVSPGLMMIGARGAPGIDFRRSSVNALHPNRASVLATIENCLARIFSKTEASTFLFFSNLFVSNSNDASRMDCSAWHWNAHPIDEHATI